MIRPVRGSWCHEMRQKFVSRTSITPTGPLAQLDERLARVRVVEQVHQLVLAQLAPTA